MDEATLISYLNNHSDDVESQMVEQWCNENPDNLKQLSDIRFIMGVAGVTDIMNNMDAEASFNSFKAKNMSLPAAQLSKEIKLVKRIHKNKWYRHTASIAAFFIGFIFSASMMLLWFSQSLNSIFTFTTDLGQRAQTILPDGSKVWINSSSKLTYTNSFWSSDRHVDLVGEAYFEVAHIDGKKFVVKSRDVETTVLGTKFNVRSKASENKIVTTLFEGSVMVDLISREGDDGYKLVPGETVEIDTNTGDIVLTKYEDPSNVLLWMGGNFKFNQKSLGEITKILESLFDVEFVFENELIRDEIFTGNFSTDSSPEQILNVLQYTNYFNYSVSGRIIYIYK